MSEFKLGQRVQHVSFEKIGTVVAVNESAGAVKVYWDERGKVESEFCQDITPADIVPAKINTRKWRDMPCGVEGCIMSTLEYAQLVQHYAARGEFAKAHAYLSAASVGQHVLSAMKFAIVEEELEVAANLRATL